ncbi:hypothetical protein LAZ67_20002585 [Cordylochernes scorpioides]|uniref:ATP-dependent DNA helicase n=1 Tax=Cordylochernes scorpioides TaxID=51811 RepID=A0ABY6LL57_9ARAC|nr:hypothetical protein LAZ67_20002585 [Cordylochernes scorpioides]
MCEVLRLLCNVSIVLGLIEKGPVLRERRNPWDSVRTGFNKRETGPVPQERRNPWNSVRTGFNKRETGPVPQERRNPWDSVRTGFGKKETGPVPQERRNPWDSARTGFNKIETGPVPQERRNPWDSVRTGFNKRETGPVPQERRNPWNSVRIGFNKRETGPVPQERRNPWDSVRTGFGKIETGPVPQERRNPWNSVRTGFNKRETGPVPQERRNPWDSVRTGFGKIETGVQGQVYHRAGSLLPSLDQPPQFLQIFFVEDAQLEVNQRCHFSSALRHGTVLCLQRMFHRCNQLIKIFKTALENMPSDEYKLVIRADKTPSGEHERRFNAPQSNDVAVVLSADEFNQRDIIIQRRSNALKRISETHRSYDPLQYPIIFWDGEDGYHFNYRQIDQNTGVPTNRKVSAMSFYSYRIMARDNVYNHILNCRQLFSQYIVDMYAKIESERLLYIRLNQKELRVEEYIHLRDAVANDGMVANFGKLVILPATFTGSPRHMHEYTQDAMVFVRTYGRPDLFITFTCNPSWPEINAELFNGQKPMDRHDLTARVFKLKLNKLIALITKQCIFGETRCWMFTIEWQKRGLPHSHILIWLKDKIHPIQIDNVISAEIPNPEEDPNLYEVVIKNMIHGPCGTFNINAPCMKNGKCSKNYPRDLISDTQTGFDGYPRYRRRAPENGGFKGKLKGRGNTEIEVDNKWVVPYSPLLSIMFKAHINVEYCHSVKSIKYICKYVNKGNDMAIFGLSKENTNDEISQYLLGRYISSNEAVWRILSFPIHERHPNVVHLSVHLENGQRVYFTNANARTVAAAPPNTTLTAFFQLCQQDPFAKNLLYPEVPRYYTWSASRKSFCRRKQGTSVPEHEGIFASEALGRVYTVHPNNAECFFLRMLLHTVRGPTSFSSLKCVNGEECRTFREACQKLGLLEDDQHWDNVLSEAASQSFPEQIRELFAILLTTCNPSNPQNLWEKYRESMSEDVLIKARRANPTLDINFSSDIFNEALLLLQNKCLAINDRTLSQLGLQSPERCQPTILNRELMREKNYNIEQLRRFVDSKKPLLVEDQREAYNSIMDCINKQQGGIIFLDAPGGTGKTFLINLLLAEVRSKNAIALAIASSGIAATLIAGGRTAHSMLKLPLNIANEQYPTCNISSTSGQAQVLKSCIIIVWDECTMAHKHSLEALDRTLRDLKGNNKLMGGILLFLAGDFRQTLPVIPRSTPADEINACLKASVLWKHIKNITLRTNLRVQVLGEHSAQNFARKLLQIGEGTFPNGSPMCDVSFPLDFGNIVSSVGELIDKVFPNIAENFRNHGWLCERTILAPRNDAVDEINNCIQDMLPGSVTEYNSINTMVDVDDTVNYPSEFLNSLNPSGLPPHHLRLKIGSPIMLLRNLDPPKLCNGTRLCVKRLLPNVIEATILTGKENGKDVLIPRIPLIPNDFPFLFKRLQFPRMPGHRKRRQFKQTDAFTRGMVIGLKRAGWSIRQIAADTHLGASTVHLLWRIWLEQGNMAIYRNVCATRVTSARVDRRILRQAVAAPQATCTAILQHVQDTLDHSISTRTISRRLVANGLHSCSPLRRLPLTPPNRRQRLEWCRARSTWMMEWHRVVFSDESRFCLSSDCRRVRVWRRRGERSNPAAIVERPTVRQRGIMVWGAIAYDSRSPLLRIQGTMTAQRYVDDVLRPVTLPYLQGVPNALYQQDNARPHTARISQQALQDVQMLPWPPYSPDLSPIEHVWDIIGRRLHALPQPRSEDELWQMVEREWRAIPQDAIRTLIDSLPRRVAACIAVRGGPTCY